MLSLRVGTRASALAITQTRNVCRDFVALHPHYTIKEVAITSEGDKNSEPLSMAKTPGIFVSALRDELLQGTVDFIVHSMKDLPAAAHPDISLAAVPRREDVRDILFTTNGETLAELPSGARVGTSSPRREASIRRKRPDLRIDSIRGNVPSRLAKVRSGEFDATVLALAGLSRLGLADVAQEILPLDDFLPAPRQGALAVECRAADTELQELLSGLDDPLARLCTTAEQGVLLGLNAGCATAVSAVATWAAGQLNVSAELAVAETGEVAHVRDVFSLDLSDLAAAAHAGRIMASRLLDSPISERAALP
jgi:hydroxymethylbilane synthase